ncbi:lisH domain-containing protein C1711.05 isoform X2 [Ananas comosus]|uniref:LisH domain-containing protein C1711.05 isoform X2 n=1 Tax=Ananas comosus TaxID=4615 RepID=A0A6P5F8U2_ANACO|nr:lisH domain-containing protein C1711.05 isoform X2 [Ananas comosus]XP_020092369.1 lisH domain-containing protein C1711.05 isoform X2 [Ananas comosus]
MREATKRLDSSSSSLIAFVPRQVMLDSHGAAAHAEGEERRREKEMKKEKKKKSKKSASGTLAEFREGSDALTLDLSNGGAVAPKGTGRGALLRSIAIFLESSGFSKTLATFKSEAKLEVDDWSSSSLSLEDIFCKFLDASNGLAEASISWQREQAPEKEGILQEAEGKNTDGASEHSQKKKRKRGSETDGTKIETSKTRAENVGGVDALDKPLDKLKVKSKETKSGVSGEEELKKSKDFGDETDFMEFKSVEESHSEIKEKKRKKKLASSLSGEEKENSEEAVAFKGATKADEEKLLPKLNENGKKKKEKKKRMVDNSSNEISKPDEDEKLKEAVKDEVVVLKSLVSESSDTKTTHKDDKKNKKKVIGNIEELEICEDGTKKTLTELKSNENLLDDDSQVREKKKKKGKSTSEDQSAKVSDLKDAGVCLTDEGGRKTDTANGKVPVTESNDENIENKISKKRKRVASKENGSKTDIEVPVKDENIRSDGAEKNKSRYDDEDNVLAKKQKTEESNRTFVEDKTAGNKLVNGQLENKKNEESASSKARKKENASSEPKSANAFRRVKADEVKFADKKLQDNSYWAKDGAEIGYGAKAQEILGQVRGRHEKTKKKRGTYRGGQIDLQSHSVKFTYDDDE